jgi:hypothetical protein
MYGEPTLRFVVMGRPHGFVASGHRHWSRRTGKAWTYAKKVRATLKAHIEGEGNEIQEPVSEDGVHLMANKEAPLRVGTVAHFVNGTHPDPENVHKLVKDALFHKAPGGDKYTAGLYAEPRYDKELPRVEVLVWELMLN